VIEHSELLARGKNVGPMNLRASLWVAFEIDAMDGEFLTAGMKLPRHVSLNKRLTGSYPRLAFH
jgi:hypothetical protein